MASATAAINPIQMDPAQVPTCAGRWLHVLSHLDPRYGGLSAAVPQLASALGAHHGEAVSLAGFCSADEVESQLPDDLDVSRWPASRMAWLQDRTLRERFNAHLKNADGLHLHGLWEQSTAIAATACRSSRKPYVLSAHGMLDRWALNNKRLKKALYAAISERENIRRAACLHALTPTEAQDYRRFGATQPIAVIPNGVSVPANVDSELFFARFPSLRGKRIILFLSRLHLKKGLDILARAWGVVSNHYREAHLVLAGPDFEGTRAKVEKWLGQQCSAQSFTFTGMLDSETKWSALRAAECFVLPSYSEGLSVATLEALGCGVPVIITEQCNLPEVAQFGAGWTIQPDTAQLSGALSEMLSHSAMTNRRIGENGRRLVEQNYSWPLIGRKMGEVYAWVLGGPLPSSVELIRS